MTALFALLAIPAVCVVSGAWYLYHLNKTIVAVPREASEISPDRWNVPLIGRTVAAIAQSPLKTRAHLPPRTGRRYVVVGGSGFLGGWIVLHLLARGEKPKNIRIIDIRPPTRDDMLSPEASQVAFHKADVTDIDSVRAAFAAEWPDVEGCANGITVFHSVAVIRYYERHPILVPRSSKVNVDGTRNVLQASRENSVDVFIFTSSASISINRTNFWTWPWQKYATTVFQTAADDIGLTSRPHNQYFSNYAYTKHLAENYVREANSPSFFTGCLRPGNAIFGSGGDLNAGAYLVRGNNPSWVAPIIQSFSYVENVSYAHLLYEERLLGTYSAALGGKSYTIADDGNPPSYADLYLALTTLSKGVAQFPPVPPALLFILAQIIALVWNLRKVASDIVHLGQLWKVFVNSALTTRKQGA